jgi:tetratricopeptide (TPR) repeat protein
VHGWGWRLFIPDSRGSCSAKVLVVLDGFDWDLDSGGKEFRRTIELNPGYATAHHWYSWRLALLGHYDEAIAEMKKAESLDPLSLIY